MKLPAVLPAATEWGVVTRIESGGRVADVQIGGRSWPWASVPVAGESVRVGQTVAVGFLEEERQAPIVLNLTSAAIVALGEEEIRKGSIWPTFGYDEGRTKFSPAAGSAPAMVLNGWDPGALGASMDFVRGWCAYRAGELELAAVAVEDGANDSKLRAVRMDTGAIEWEVSLAGADLALVTLNCLAYNPVHGELVLVGPKHASAPAGSKGKIWRFDAADGTEIGSSVSDTYMGLDYGFTLAGEYLVQNYHPSNSKLRARKRGSSNSYDFEWDSVVLGSFPGQSNSVIYESPLPSSRVHDLIVVPGSGWLAGAGPEVVWAKARYTGVEISTGSVLWEYNLEDTAPGNYDHSDFLALAPVLAGNRAGGNTFAMDSDGNFYGWASVPNGDYSSIRRAISLDKDGGERWNVQLPIAVQDTDSITVTEDRVLYSDYSAGTAALDRDTGKLRWIRVHSASPIFSGSWPTIAGGAGLDQWFCVNSRLYRVEDGSELVGWPNGFNGKTYLAGAYQKRIWGVRTESGNVDHMRRWS